MSFAHLGAAICHRWTIICGVASKICDISIKKKTCYEKFLKNLLFGVGFKMIGPVTNGLINTYHMSGVSTKIVILLLVTFTCNRRDLVGSVLTY